MLSLLSFSTNAPQEPLVFATDPNIFYNDLAESEQQHWHGKLLSQTLATFHAPATGASWTTIPASYLLCEDDQAIPAQGQEAMVKGARELGAKVEVQRIKASHSPFLSRVEETVEWVRGVAGEKV